MKNRVLIVGDLMIDRYLIGNIGRISPEAPVPVLNIKSKIDRLGGASNVANNLICNGINTDIAGVVGNDDDGKLILSMLKNANIGCEMVMVENERPTTVKSRCVAQNNQQMLRMDTETTDSISKNVEEELISKLKKEIKNYAAIILSDYLKGVLSDSFTQAVISIANENEIPVLADIKDKNYKKYANAFLLKPNKNELKTIMEAKSDKDSLINASRKLLNEANVKYVLTTLGADGMMLTNKKSTEFILSKAKEVYDVTGAGDTVIAFLCMGILKNMSVFEAVEFANVAAGIKVSKLGAYAVSEYEVLKETNGVNHKIINNEELSLIDWENKKIVFTNGCFDVLHIGHISSLQAAKQLGDILVVGLNSDKSVKQLKGASRPFNRQEYRAELLAALEFVDYICIFDELTPEKLIKELKPDILVKGKDYENKEVVGQKFVESYGGKVVLLDMIDGMSSTNLINKMGE